MQTNKLETIVSLEPEPPSRTPWGAARERRRIAEGLWWVTAGDAGGVWVSKARLSEMDASWRAHDQWYSAAEAEWTLPACHFKDLFSIAYGDAFVTGAEKIFAEVYG